MAKIVVVYFSQYGHTKKVAEKVADGAEGILIEIDQNGDINESDWTRLNDSDAIIFGAPTYMAGPPWQFKKFSDSTSKIWFQRKWQDKIFGGFTNSGSINGDKQVTLIALQTLASQHGGIWVSLGLLPSNTKSSSHNDINYLGGSVGALIQSPSDASVDEIPLGDLKTAQLYGARIAQITKKFIN